MSHKTLRPGTRAGTLTASRPSQPAAHPDRSNGKGPFMQHGVQTETQEAPGPRTATRGERASALDRSTEIVPVLMAGGFGTRLWPLSTPDRPKQFLTEWQDRSLFQQAWDRALQLAPAGHVLVMTSASLAPFVQDQAPDLPPENLVLEPLRRDTGPAAVLAALVAARRWPEAVMAIFPSDHFIGNEWAFGETVAAAVDRAKGGGLGTIGISPASPATRFGYLHLHQPPEPLVPQPVHAFVEKPDRDRAEAYLATGRYLWNSGIFIWQARALLEAARRHLPETCAALAGVAEHVGQTAFGRRAKDAFEQIEAVSVDYGIMEKASDVWCVPASFEWDDVGGWLAAERLLPADANGNRIHGQVYVDTVTGCVVVGTPTHPLAVAGLTDCIVVHGDAGTLVCHKSAADRIKPIIEQILRGDQRY